MASEPSQVESFPVTGVRCSAIAAGVRYADRLDLVLIELAEQSRTAAVFTRNAFCAAPVQIARQNLHNMQPRYLLVNTGNANAGTGEQGLEHARTCCEAVASLAGCDADAVLPFSTGVIGEPLPVTRITDGVPAALKGLNADNWPDAARGIMTTDTRPKLASVQLALGGKTVTVSGIAKGAGMIKPDMATMLAFVFTDLKINQARLQQLLLDSVNNSFNRITVDGDTSTNDACTLSATGETGIELESLSASEQAEFCRALDTVFGQLARGLIRDAEGASKFITVRISGGRSSAECLKVAYTIAESPLVKTAMFASDPNWGRILAAIGRAGIEDLEIDRVTIRLGETLIVEHGGVAASYQEEAGQREMDAKEIEVGVQLGRGESEELVWTSDLSHEYVRINAEYRS